MSIVVSANTIAAVRGDANNNGGSKSYLLYLVLLSEKAVCMISYQHNK